MTSAERVRISTIRSKVLREDGEVRLPMEIAPFGTERKRFLALYQDLGIRLQPAAKSDIHDRVHGFLMGFPALRGADGAVATMMLNDFVEALEDFPMEVVHRACKGWNKRQFKWANYSYPPNPPELNRAARETRLELQVEQYDLKIILLAKPVGQTVPALPAPEGKPTTVAAAVAELKAAVARAETPPTTDPQKDPAPAPARYSPGYLDALEARRARREAQADLTPPSRLRVLAEPNQGASA